MICQKLPRLSLVPVCRPVQKKTSMIAQIVTLFIALPLYSATVVDFDSLSDNEAVTSQFSGLGVLFQNGVALTAGLSLNEFEFPPRSDFNVAGDSAGPLSILFLAPQFSVFGYFTHNVALTMDAFDAGDNLLSSVSSLAGCDNNLLLSGVVGCLPNEQIGLTGVGAIARIMITGAQEGSSFALDDLTFAPLVDIPEPSTAFYVAGAAAALVIQRNRRSRRSIRSVPQEAIR